MSNALAIKKEIVSGVADVASKAVSLVVADYRGIAGNEMTDLRAKARSSDVYLRVVRNTLAKRAVADTDFECARDAFVGSVFLAFSMEEPSAAARLLKDFGKENENLEVKAISIGGKLLDAGQLEAVAKLPTYEEALSKLLSVMQAPIAKLVRTLAAPQLKLVRTLMAVRDKKQDES